MNPVHSLRRLYHKIAYKILLRVILLSVRMQHHVQNREKKLMHQLYQEKMRRTKP